MRDMLWRMGITLTVLVTLLVFGANASCSSSLVTGEANNVAPKARLSAFMAAIAEGDRSEAVSSWFVDGTSPVLAARREAITDDLMLYGPRLEYHVLDMEWWRTSATPGKIDDASGAGAARVSVAISSEAKTLQIYHFDLLLREGSNGSVTNRPHWIVIDVYPEGSAALAWPWR